MNWMRPVPSAPDPGGAPGGAPAAPGGGGAPAPAPAPAAPPAPAPGGGGAAPAAPKPADPPAPAPAPSASPAPPAPIGYRPANLPDHLAGATDQETIDKLFKSVDGFRQAQAAKGEMPADAKGYEFTPTEVVKPYATALGADPFMGKVQEFAFSRGIPKGQFNAFINDVLGEMVAGQMVDAPFSADKEREALLPDVTDPKERATQADRMANEAIARVKTWQEQGMPEAIAKDLLARTDRASTIQLVNWIAAGRREAAPVLGGAAPGGAPSPADLRGRQADERNIVGNAKYDRSFAAETDRLYRLAYPDTGNR